MRTDEVVWHSPSGETITSSSDPRISLHDSNTRLVIRNVELGDSGTYQVNIRREITVASATIELNVLGE